MDFTWLFVTLIVIFCLFCFGLLIVAFTETRFYKKLRKAIEIMKED